MWYYCITWPFDLNLFIYLRFIAKQVIPNYINHSRPLIPDGIHLFFLNEVWEEREARPVLICRAPSKEASGTIFITTLVWRGRGSNPRPPAHGANALTTEPTYHLLPVFYCRSYRNPNTAEILADFEAPRPKTVPANMTYQRNQPMVPAPYFFRHFNKPMTANSSKKRTSPSSQFEGGCLSSVVLYWYCDCFSFSL